MFRESGGPDHQNNSENAENQLPINFGQETASMSRWRAMEKRMKLSSPSTSEDIFTLLSHLYVRMHFVCSRMHQLCTFCLQAGIGPAVGLSGHQRSRMHFMHLFSELDLFQGFSFKGNCIRYIKAHTAMTPIRP